MNCQLELVTDTTQLEQQDKIIRNGITAFNAGFTVDRPERFSVYMKTEEGHLIGGALVYVHPTSVYVDVLWVDEAYRGLGIGARLLQCVETEAVRRGIPASTLDTFSFQAEGFYRKQGYQHLGTIKDYLQGYDRIYLRKKLTPERGNTP